LYLHALLTIPTTERLTEIAREYGDIYSLKIISETIIVLSSATVIRDIIEKNSAIVSDRPHSHMGHEVTDGKNMGIAHYGLSIVF
jgi:hypothetical protein